MKTTLSLAILGIAAAAGAARAAETPLLVAVEVLPGVGGGVGAADVRQAIAAELGVAVVAAREPNAANASDVLLVTVEPREIRMALRTGASPVVARTIAAPADPPGRLRSIGWLAGNLVRDQVGPLVATAASPPPIAEARLPTQPPPIAEGPPPTEMAGPAAVVASGHSSRDNVVPHAGWSITASGGPTLNLIHTGSSPPFGDTMFFRSTAYRIEVQHQSTTESTLFGAALEVGPDLPYRHYFGGAAFVGSSWRRRAWFIEGNLGLGLEVLDQFVKTLTVTNTSDTLGTVSETTLGSTPVPALYARVAGTLGVTLTQSFDLVAQLGAHLSSSGQVGSYLSSMVGVRLRLP